MRTHSMLAAVLCIAALPAASLVAQTISSDSSSQSTPPKTVAGKSLDEWIEDIKDRDPGVRVEALKAVLQFGEDSRRAVPVIVDLLNKLEYDASVKVHACIVLLAGEVRNDDVPDVVRALTRRMSEDREAIVRYHAALALGRFKEEAAAAVPKLIRATKDRSAWEIRQAAVSSLAKVAGAMNESDPQVINAIKALVEALRRDDSSKVRLEATMGLGAMGPPADMKLRAAVKQVLTSKVARGDRDKRVVVWAYVGLMYVDKPKDEYLDGLAKLLKNGDVLTRCQAARALGTLGKLAREKVPELLEAVKDKELSVASNACWALGEMGRHFDPGDKVSKTLDGVVKSTTAAPALRQMAVAALDRIKGRKDTAIEKKPEDDLPLPRKP